MKNQATQITLALALCALVGTAALAKSKFHSIPFTQITTVNGTFVKPGAYEVKFDEQSDEFSILDDNNHAIVTAKAHEEALGRKADATRYKVRNSGDGSVLTQVIFSGDRYAIVLDDSGNQTGGGK